MPSLPHHAIDEFQVLWKKHYGAELPADQAAARAHQVFTVLRLLIEPSLHNTPHPDPSTSVPFEEAERGIGGMDVSG